MRKNRDKLYNLPHCYTFMLTDLFIPFVAIFLAELGDKTQLAILTLTTKYDCKFSLFFGSLLAFALADGAAILFAGSAALYVPTSILKAISGTLFIVFGFFMLREKDEDEIHIKKRIPFAAAFILIFFAELGDKTQLASALFATQYSPLFVFIGMISALALLTGSALLLGHLLFQKIDKKYLSLSAAFLFIIIGIFTLTSLLLGIVLP
jgi:putative Ca2+/H+ antiporter (TMEM165/GDT1 family)